jgi:hypothetical protein
MPIFSLHCKRLFYNSLVAKKVTPKPSLKKAKSSEVHAYAFIKRELDAQGWDIRNPDRIATGQVYTQNECLGNEEMAKFLKLDRPE